MTSRRRVLITLLVPIVGLLGLEWGLRRFADVPHPPCMILVDEQMDARMYSGHDAHRPHAKWLWEPRPGTTPFHERLNEGGYRGPAIPHERTPGHLRIVTLGDSGAFGFGVSWRESWPVVLGDELTNEGIPAEVVNLAAINYTLFQGDAIYADKVRPYRPDLVIAGFGTANEAKLTDATDEEKVTMLANPVRRGIDVMRESALFRFIERLARPAALGTERVRRVPLDRYARLLASLRDKVEGDGARLVLILPPRRLDHEWARPETVEYTERTREFARANGVPLIDVRAEFRRIDPVPPGPVRKLDSELFIDTLHPSVKGHRVVAETIARGLYDGGLIPGTEPTKTQDR